MAVEKLTEPQKKTLRLVEAKQVGYDGTNGVFYHRLTFKPLMASKRLEELGLILKKSPIPTDWMNSYHAIDVVLTDAGRKVLDGVSQS